MPKPHTWAKFFAGPAAATLLLSFLAAAEILRPDVLASSRTGQWPPLQRQATCFALFTVIALISALISARQKPPGQLRKAPRAVSALVGLGMFSLPSVLFLLTAPWIDGFARLALLTLTPLFAIVFEPYLGGDFTPNRPGQSGSGLQSSSRVAASLAAVAGAALVLPISIPSTFSGGVAFIGVVVASASGAAANCLAVRLANTHEQPSGEKVSSFTPFPVYTGVAATLSFALLSAFIERRAWNQQSWLPELAWSVCIDVPELLLLFWLMHRTTALRMTTRFIFSPLIAILAEAVFLRPVIERRMALGLLLMAIGASWLLFASEGTDEPQSLSLR